MHLPLEHLEITQPEWVEFDPKRSVYLDTLAVALRTHTYPGYPAKNQRLYSDSSFINQEGLVALPNEGSWVTGSVFPTREEKFSDCIAMIGYPKHYRLDADYRPLHPWWRDMLRNPDIGGVVGRGFYYHWGANYAADAAVTTTDKQGKQHLLLIRRKDTGDWALPGGFVDDAETSKQAALRELQEESNLLINAKTATSNMLYSGPVLDIRTTLHAWTETSLWHFSIPQANTLPIIHGGDDAADAAWLALDALPDNLYGSHPVLVDMALTALALETEVR